MPVLPNQLYRILCQNSLIFYRIPFAFHRSSSNKYDSLKGGGRVRMQRCLITLHFKKKLSRFFETHARYLRKVQAGFPIFKIHFCIRSTRPRLTDTHGVVFSGENDLKIFRIAKISSSPNYLTFHDFSPDYFCFSLVLKFSIPLIFPDLWTILSPTDFFFFFIRYADFCWTLDTIFLFKDQMTEKGI